MQIENQLITLSMIELKALMIEVSEIAAEKAIESFTTFNIKDAAAKIGITPKTLTAHIKAGKIKAANGRISGKELARYLEIH
jgi:predicted DNA-binding protein (UPF0251 family)